jgi:hypothetical protein
MAAIEIQLRQAQKFETGRVAYLTLAKAKNDKICDITSSV